MRLSNRHLFSTQTTYENFRYQYDRKMNPYNVGIFRNCMEVFCSRKPRSRNDFRALVRNDSPVNSYTGATSDLEMGRRRGFDADDFEDPRNRIGHLGRLERCRTQPRHDHWEDRRGNWRWPYLVTIFLRDVHEIRSRRRRRRRRYQYILLQFFLLLLAIRTIIQSGASKIVYLSFFLAKRRHIFVLLELG